MGFFRVHTTLQAKVVVLKLVPGFDDECVHALVSHSSKYFLTLVIRNGVI
jgi:L-asparaginase/Glu-tRNA(Gln) amidotransferase subunit D